MTIHFAYGSNMSRALMSARCPQARPLGVGRLDGYRFIITGDGYASVSPNAGSVVHGVLWRLTPRDLTALNAYESLHTGLYRRTRLLVRHSGASTPALVYRARERGEGRPRPGYLDIVLEAAQEWNLPADYIRALSRWGPNAWRGARAVEIGDLA